MIVGASRGLGRAFVQGICSPGDTVIGVSRSPPDQLTLPECVSLQWIEADLADPLRAALRIEADAPPELDALIDNLGPWEEAAFTSEYSFLKDKDARIMDMVYVNITGAILLLQRLVPRLLASPHPRLMLTGSTSGLRQSGRPKVTFGASKFALTGMTDALRESLRSHGLAVT